MGLNRRRFLQVLGVGGVAIAAAPQLLLPNPRALPGAAPRVFLPPARGWPGSVVLPREPFLWPLREPLSRYATQRWTLVIEGNWTEDPAAYDCGTQPVSVFGAQGYLMERTLEFMPGGPIRERLRYDGIGAPPSRLLLPKHSELQVRRDPPLYSLYHEP